VVPELRLIRYFVAVAEERNFTRAAERLHIAQPPLSTAIRQLEDQLGTALLERTSREVRLTPAGTLLLERGRALLAEAEDVAAAVRSLEGEMTGRLRIGISPAARFGAGADLLAACTRRLPGVALLAQEDTTGALLRGLRTGSVDLAVLYCPAPMDGVELLPLRDEPAGIHLSAAHPLADRLSVALEELRDEPFLVAGSGESDGWSAAVIERCRAAGFEPRTVPDPHPDLGQRAVRAGLGVVLYACSGITATPGETALVPLDPPVTLPIVLGRRAGTRNAALDAVVEVAQDL